MVVIEITKGMNVGFMGLGNEGAKVGEGVLAITNISLDKRSLEIPEGARSGDELWKCFPKCSEVRIYKEGGIELHLLMIMQESSACEEALKLCEVPMDRRWMGWIKNWCIGFSWDWHIKSRFGHGSQGREASAQ